jgi:hypothetical protein
MTVTVSSLAGEDQLILHGRHPAEILMSSFLVVEDLDVIKDISVCLSPSPVDSPSNTLFLKTAEERLHVGDVDAPRPIWLFVGELLSEQIVRRLRGLSVTLYAFLESSLSLDARPGSNRRLRPGFF